MCYVRVPTWLPFRLQIYFNGHNWLACKLKESGISYKMLENAFIEIQDWERHTNFSKSLRDLRFKLAQIDAFLAALNIMFLPRAAIIEIVGAVGVDFFFGCHH